MERYKRHFKESKVELKEDTWAKFGVIKESLYQFILENKIDKCQVEIKHVDDQFFVDIEESKFSLSPKAPFSRFRIYNNDGLTIIDVSDDFKTIFDLEFKSLTFINRDKIKFIINFN